MKKSILDLVAVCEMKVMTLLRTLVVSNKHVFSKAWNSFAQQTAYLCSNRKLNSFVQQIYSFMLWSRIFFGFHIFLMCFVQLTSNIGNVIGFACSKKCTWKHSNSFCVHGHYFCLQVLMKKSKRESAVILLLLPAFLS